MEDHSDFKRTNCNEMEMEMELSPVASIGEEVEEEVLEVIETKVKGKRKRANTELAKPHRCNWEGCTKAFSRPDHLARHCLNHAPVEVFICDRCAKEFVRNDLLIRAERHEKRENSLGGDTNRGPGVGKGRKSRIIPLGTHSIISNPIASGSGSNRNNNMDLATINGNGDGTISLPMGHQQILGPSNGNLLNSLPSWGFQPQQNRGVGGGGVDSTNNLPPFDYDYPGGLTPLNFPSSNISLTPVILNQQQEQLNGFSPADFSVVDNSNLTPYLEDPLSSFIQASYGAMNYSNYDWLFAPDSNCDVTLMSSRPATPGQEFAPGMVGVGGSGMNSKNSGLDPTYVGNLVDLLGPGFEVEPHVWSGAGPSSIDSGPTTASPQEFSDRSTDISAATRARIFSYLGPEWSHLITDERLSSEAIKEYLHLFWTRYDEAQAATFHRASFRAGKAHAALLIAMMLVGTYFGSKEAHELAVAIHPSFRGKVFCSGDFRPRAKLWLHQTLVLVVIFGKLCSTRAAHEMSHIFWSSVVTLGRRSTLFSVKTIDTTLEPSTDPEVLWSEWVIAESSKRIAYLTFSLDSEHAAFFRHSISLSAFQLQLTLPCSEEEWEASNAQDWLRIHNESKPPIPFISALKASLVPQGGSIGAGMAQLAFLNSASRVAVLHGLISVAQDLQWRDHVIGFGQPESRAHNWREMMSAAYNTWKAALDNHLIDIDSLSTTQLLRSSISLYAVAHITLSVDIHELQIFAGASSALGIVITDSVREASKTKMMAWSTTKEGRAACWHSAFFLRSSLQNDQVNGTAASGNSNSLHHGWCVYQATLAIYCFGLCTDGPAPEEIIEGGDFRQDTMAYLDKLCTTSPNELDHVPNKNDVLCVCETTCEYLSDTRWEIAQEGATILRKLLPAYKKKVAEEEELQEKERVVANLMMESFSNRIENEILNGKEGKGEGEVEEVES